ncbi:MAG: 3-dehydroquinate synthase [Frankiaceae bacterium]|nr:3-dehydroquinate synthase [Frankiaceae bacterium]
MTTIRVDGPPPYDVVVELGATRALPAVVAGAGAVVVVADERLSDRADEIARLLSGVEVTVELVPSGEQAKTVANLDRLWQAFADAGLSRSGAVVSVGGGATTDLAGFAAATWMRGVRVVHVPTTLLAMVDAAVGGKTGVNTAAGKNLVGAFHPPAAVLVDLDVLSTLPDAEWTNGMAEVVKAGFVADTGILDLVRDDAHAHADELVERSVAMKAAVVSEDPGEAGRREILNYGHTLGHAIERRGGYLMPHGHAVSIGMVYAAELAEITGIGPVGLAAGHRELLSAVGLPTSYDAGAFDELYDAMRLDKKARAGRLRFVVLADVGKPVGLDDPGRDLLAAAYERLAAS